MLLLQVMGPIVLLKETSILYSIKTNMFNTTNNVLSTSVPNLNVSGTNQAIFVFHFRILAQGKELWGYFNSSIPCPVLSFSAVLTYTNFYIS